MAADKPARGSIGNEIFDEVERLVAGGMNKSQAFKEISERTGRESGTVAANYYRVARQRGADLRPRRRRAESSRVSGGGDVQAALARVTQALDDLTRAIKKQDGEIKKLREQSSDVDEIRRLARRFK